MTFATEAYQVKKGDTILVYSAAGGVGLILNKVGLWCGRSCVVRKLTVCLQIALNIGATVIGTVSSEEKARVVRDQGVQHVIVTSQQNTVEEVLRITNGEGVQAVFDGVGKGEYPSLPMLALWIDSPVSDTFEDNFKIVARKGTIVSIGNASGPPPPVGPHILGDRNLKYLRPR